MGKRCIICEKEANFKVKDTSDYYCGECAEEHFGDISLLVGIEQQAKKLKAIVDEKTEE